MFFSETRNVVCCFRQTIIDIARHFHLLSRYFCCWFPPESPSDNKQTHGLVFFQARLRVSNHLSSLSKRRKKNRKFRRTCNGFVGTRGLCKQTAHAQNPAFTGPKGACRGRPVATCSAPAFAGSRQPATASCPGRQAATEAPMHREMTASFEPSSGAAPSQVRNKDCLSSTCD